MMDTYQILTLLIMFGGFIIALIDFIRKIIKEYKSKKRERKMNTKAKRERKAKAKRII